MNKDTYEVLYRGKPKSAKTIAREIAYDIAGVAPTLELENTLKAWEAAIRDHQEDLDFEGREVKKDPEAGKDVVTYKMLFGE